ncbi:hypothetical protein BC834DRAFT_635603 [Gloeopeniophorella convolvens]|nr:hypothetical protein BC834DRAFT_635603 [Gloeopeniophorella convolvens]
MQCCWLSTSIPSPLNVGAFAIPTTDPCQQRTSINTIQCSVTTFAFVSPPSDRAARTKMALPIQGSVNPAVRSMPHRSFMLRRYCLTFVSLDRSLHCTQPPWRHRKSLKRVLVAVWKRSTPALRRESSGLPAGFSLIVPCTGTRRRSVSSTTMKTTTTTTLSVAKHSVLGSDWTLA